MLNLPLNAGGSGAGVGPFLADDGTAAAPAYSFNSDSTNGMYLAGTDTLGFSTGGTLRLSISTAAVISALPIVGSAASASFSHADHIATPAIRQSSAGATTVLSASGQNINFLINGVSGWTISSGAHLTPNNANTFDIGSAGAQVRSAYIGTTLYVGATASSLVEKFRVDGTIAPTANANGYVSQFGGTITEADSGIHPVLAGAAFLAPTLTAAAAATTVLTNLYVGATPTGATNNYGLYVAGHAGFANNVGIYGHNTSGVSILLMNMDSANICNIGSASGSANGTRIFGGGQVTIWDSNFRCAGAAEVDGAFDHDGTTVGFYGVAPVVRQTSGADLTNSVTAGGVDNTITDWTIVDYATDAAAIRNAAYQLARKLKQVNDALRLLGLLT